MDKIAVITLHFYNNFGSVLQAYALRKTVQALTGREVDILPYRPALPEYKYFQDSFLQQCYQEKCKRFRAFRRKHLGMEYEIDSSLHSEQRVSKIMAVYSACIVGSDIVWGREFSGLDAMYFLEHVREGGKRISYAASVVLDRNNDTEENSLFEKYLPNFNAISVRETSAVHSIQRFTKRNVSAVLDPTLLLDADAYEGLVKENEDMHQQPYLLSYFLTHDPAVVDYTNLLAQKLGLRIIHYFADYPDRVFPKGSKCFAFSEPGEFLGYIKNAECIFTNSFHGTCFACVYRKPFYTYMAKRAMLSRVRDMAYRLGMEGQFFVDFRDIMNVTGQMDYAPFEEKLKLERDYSIGFLKNALEV